jgi:hypothetical protein
MSNDQVAFPQKFCAVCLNFATKASKTVSLTARFEKERRKEKDIESKAQSGYSWAVNPIRVLLFVLLLALPAAAAEPASAKIIKVLPQYLDLQGQISTAPSLYSRDAYQAMLRDSPKQRSGIRFMVQWKASEVSQLVMRVELRGAGTNAPTTTQLETTVKHTGWFSTWSEIALKGEPYKAFGEMLAWRVTLWDGNQVLAEQKSFLW